MLSNGDWKREQYDKNLLHSIFHIKKYKIIYSKTNSLGLVVDSPILKDMFAFFSFTTNTNAPNIEGWKAQRIILYINIILITLPTYGYFLRM